MEGPAASPVTTLWRRVRLSGDTPPAGSKVGADPRDGGTILSVRPPPRGRRIWADRATVRSARSEPRSTCLTRDAPDRNTRLLVVSRRTRCRKNRTLEHTGNTPGRGVSLTGRALSPRMNSLFHLKKPTGT